MLTVVPKPESRSRVPSEEGPARPELSSPGEPSAEVRAKKKKDKVRSAWISFAGRIVAQVTGAIASVALTLMVVQKVQHAPAAAHAEPSPPTQAAAVSAPGLTAASVASVAARVPAIAVLPLDNFSGDPAQDALANGLTEALTADLAQIDGLTVISRTSAMRYRGARKTLPEIARELGVTHLIEGSLVRDKAHVRITAQLIDAASDRHVWARSYDRSVGNMLGVQAEVADAIAQGISAAIAQGNGR